jgi:hypothetical protein
LAVPISAADPQAWRALELGDALLQCFGARNTVAYAAQHAQRADAPFQGRDTLQSGGLLVSVWCRFFDRGDAGVHLGKPLTNPLPDVPQRCGEKNGNQLDDDDASRDICTFTCGRASAASTSPSSALLSKMFHAMCASRF